MNEPLLVHHRVTGIWDNFDYHSHQEFEIYFFHAGSCRYLINNQIYDLKPGDILLMDGMALHKPNVSPGSEYIRSTIHFSPQWIESVLRELGGMYLLEVFQKIHHCLIRTYENEESKQLEKLIVQLEEARRGMEAGNAGMETEMKILFLQVLVIVNRMGRTDSRKLPAKKAEKTEHAENISKFIQSNYMEKVSVDSIAHSLNLSKSYASHVFKEMTGFTIMEYVMGCRLQQVKYLLEIEPDKALKDIAHECGFESVSHFSRYFRDKVGITAKDYRRIRRKIYS